MRWLLLPLLMAVLAGSSRAPAPGEPAEAALQRHGQLVAAIQRRDEAALQAALGGLRPAVAALVRQVRQRDPSAARAVEAPLLRLEALSLRQPPPWAELLREASLLGEALRRAP